MLERTLTDACGREMHKLKGVAMSASKWTPERAHAWYRDIGVIRGCNYLPRTAVNMTEMWQAETFDPETIDQELGWAEQAGYNSIRIFIQYLVWESDPAGMKRRIDSFLSIAARHHIRPMIILFCDCAFSGKEPYLGPQADPVPGIHNSGWVPSPGFSRIADQSAWPALQRYVQDLVGHFGQDPRVLIWDLYNEPGNSNRDEQSLPLLEAVFAWARETDPVQPLTTGPWMWNAYTDVVSHQAMELSDVISFHFYQSSDLMDDYLARCQTYGRPVLCTEWLRRQHGNNFAAILPLFSKHRIGWYHWGWVAGKTQTYLPWESKAGDAAPKVWQHDMLHPDGTPYDPDELDRVRRFEFGIDS